MRYIWENYTPEYYFSTKYNRSILEAIQPYINEPNEISVNIKGRLENVFDSQISKLLDSSKHNDDYYNIIIHYLAQLDLVLGTSRNHTAQTLHTRETHDLSRQERMPQSCPTSP